MQCHLKFILENHWILILLQHPRTLKMLMGTHAEEIVPSIALSLKTQSAGTQFKVCSANVALRGCILPHKEIEKCSRMNQSEKRIFETEQETWGTSLAFCDMLYIYAMSCMRCVCCVRLTSESCSINIYQSVRMVLDGGGECKVLSYMRAKGLAIGRKQKGDSVEILYAGRCSKQKHLEKTLTFPWIVPFWTRIF